MTQPRKVSWAEKIHKVALSHERLLFTRAREIGRTAFWYHRFNLLTAIVLLNIVASYQDLTADLRQWHRLNRKRAIGIRERLTDEQFFSVIQESFIRSGVLPSSAKFTNEKNQTKRVH